MTRTLDGDLAALSEGMCPEDLAPLRVTGWCTACQRWYQADFPERVITVTFPGPLTAPPEP